MDIYEMAALIIGVAVGGFLLGAFFIKASTQHIIKSHKRIPHFLREVGIRKISEEEG